MGSQVSDEVMTAGREGTFQTTGSASAKAGCVLEMARSSAWLQAQNTERWNGEATDQPWRNRVFFLYSDSLS